MSMKVVRIKLKKKTDQKNEKHVENPTLSLSFKGNNRNDEQRVLSGKLGTSFGELNKSVDIWRMIENQALHPDANDLENNFLKNNSRTQENLRRGYPSNHPGRLNL